MVAGSRAEYRNSRMVKSYTPKGKRAREQVSVWAAAITCYSPIACALTG